MFYFFRFGVSYLFGDDIIDLHMLKDLNALIDLGIKIIHDNGEEAILGTSII